MSGIQHLKTNFEVKFAKDAPEGTFSGYASIFNHEDFGGDVILKGAFKQTLADWAKKGKLPKMLLQHGGGYFGGSSEDMIPIGKWNSMEEDSKGLYVEGRLIALDTDRGKALHAAMREGEMDGLSIGYRAKEFILGTKPEEPYRTIKRLDLMEVSVVLFGMNDKALVDSVKSDMIDAINTLSEAEEVLREAGIFSRKAATAFVSRLARIAQREAGAGTKGLSGLIEEMRSVKF